jgi:hypothetical protein
MELILDRPDPANIVAHNIWVGNMLEMLVRDREEKRINASAAARSLGYDARYFHGSPWRIPGFGLKGMMHSLAAWRAWNERPEAARRAEWDAMPLDQRRLARGFAE